MHPTLACATARAHEWLAWLSALTLGQFWAAIYNPPDKPWKIAIVVVALAYRAPEWFARWQRRRAGRRVVPFAYPVPKVCPSSPSYLRPSSFLFRLRARSHPLPTR